MLSAIVLAGGEGKRMKSDKCKVVHTILSKELVCWVTDAAKDAGVNDICVVVGHKEEQVRACLGDGFFYTTQKEQKGTGHAVMMAEEFLKDREGTVLVLCGDAPLVTSETLKGLIDTHVKNKNAGTLISAIIEDPKGYGRIVRNKTGSFEKITEHRDCSQEELKITECNAGMYCFEVGELLGALKEINCNNDQNEYYLTDVMEILVRKGGRVDTYVLSDNNEMYGVSDRLQLAQSTEILRRRYVEKQMINGVTFINPDSCYVSPDVQIGNDTIIYPNCILEGKVEIGRDCVIGPDTNLRDVVIGNKTDIVKSVVNESKIGSNTKVGPFAYIRPGNVVGDHVKVGDFVELKKANIGNGTKISHLTYVGDADVGEECNIACGVVTVNYDGSKKFRTKIGDNCFIGCNVNLVAPVEIEDEAYIAAGSTIVNKVPAKALAIARERQITKEGWVETKGKYRRKGK